MFRDYEDVIGFLLGILVAILFVDSRITEIFHATNIFFSCVFFPPWITQGLWDVRRDDNESKTSCIMNVYLNVAFSKKTMFKGVSIHRNHFVIMLYECSFL